ncbi:MAG: hypothetical protein DSO00_06170 [Archaeoglobi archaeon]|nr:MAG: hypothetical protein DSO00_06170 [Archaeoglobi archaeon]
MAIFIDFLLQGNVPKAFNTDLPKLCPFIPELKLRVFWAFIFIKRWKRVGCGYMERVRPEGE